MLLTMKTLLKSLLLGFAVLNAQVSTASSVPQNCAGIDNPECAVAHQGTEQPHQLNKHCDKDPEACQKLKEAIRDARKERLLTWCRENVAQCLVAKDKAVRNYSSYKQMCGSSPIDCDNKLLALLQQKQVQSKQVLCEVDPSTCSEDKQN